jgi:DivIVA domain-containing protein
MSEFDGPGESLDEPVTQLWTGARFGDLGDRLARARGTVEGTKADLPRLGPSWNLDDVVDREPVPSGEPWASRFRFAWRGYDRAAVDQYVAELERELAALQAQSPSASSVVEEIERISDQTAAILRVAYEQAEAAIRRARTAAERRVAEAQSEASAITVAAKQQLGVLDNETHSVWRERARLIADVRKLADGLSSLAQEAADRFPAEVEKAEQSASAEPDPGTELPNGHACSELRDA